MITLNYKQEQAIKEHALNCYPEEMCGIIVKDEFIPLKNNSEEPLHSFKISPKDISEYAGDITAIVHSHCRDKNIPEVFDTRTPTVADVKGQKLTNVPWLIVATEGIEVTPPIEIPREPSAELFGRPFIWIVSDCYNLVYDYYKFYLNIELKGHLQEVDYVDFLKVDGFLDQYLEEYSFKEIPLHEIANGDLIVLNMGRKARNHLGIFHDNTIIHQGIVSCQEPFDYYIGRIAKVLHYVG